MKNITLLGKWMKSENTSSKESRFLGKKIREYLNITPKEYRKMLSALRESIRVLERDLCSNNWDKIDYSHIPSRAGLLYRKAFFRHDKERYEKFMEDVKSGKEKVNASVLYPYDIVNQMMSPYGMIYKGTSPNGRYNLSVKELPSEERESLNMFWNALPNYLENRPHNGLVVCDTSGSMRGQPIAVAISLAIYFAERNIGKFKDSFITFSNNPELQLIEGKDLYEKVANLATAQWDQNTNLQRVFDLVLTTAIDNHLAVEEMPESIYIISDMEFDKATEKNTRTNFKEIEMKYNESGYKMPELVFWNVDAKTKQSPIEMDKENNAKLVSGCSPSILKNLLDGKTITAYDLMLDVLNSKRYDNIVV